jgi:hypothetical protein
MFSLGADLLEQGLRNKQTGEPVLQELGNNFLQGITTPIGNINQTGYQKMGYQNYNDYKRDFTNLGGLGMIPKRQNAMGMNSPMMNSSYQQPMNQGDNNMMTQNYYHGGLAHFAPHHENYAFGGPTGAGDIYGHLSSAIHPMHMAHGGHAYMPHFGFGGFISNLFKRGASMASQHLPGLISKGMEMAKPHIGTLAGMAANKVGNAIGNRFGQDYGQMASGMLNKGLTHVGNMGLDMAGNLANQGVQRLAQYAPPQIPQQPQAPQLPMNAGQTATAAYGGHFGYDY